MLQDLNRCNAMRGLQLLRCLRKPTAAPSLSESPSKRRLKDGRDWWGDEKSKEAGARGVTGSRVHHFNAYLIVCFLPALSVHPRCRHSVTAATYRWRSIHFEKHRPFSGLSITKCHRLHGGGDELRRKAPLPVLEPGDRGKKKRVDSACMYAVAGSHKSWPSSIYTGSILMVSYLLHSLSPSYIV